MSFLYQSLMGTIVTGQQVNMIKIAEFGDSFQTQFNEEPRKVLVYGAGQGYFEKKDLIPNIRYICDVNADNIGNIDGIRVLSPNVLNEIHEPIYIVVSVKATLLFREICDHIKRFDIDAIVFHLYNNVAFEYNFYKTAVSNYTVNNSTRLRVNIACIEPKWILRKFADRMSKELEKYDIDVSVTDHTMSDVDINHHISFAAFKPYPNDTIMVTHVNCQKLLDITRHQLETASLGICMSKETMNLLVNYGIPRRKLCYINPAHDGLIKPKKYVIGITHRCYDKQDVRKRTNSVLEMVEGVDPTYFEFIIMGAGWDTVVCKLRALGFDVEFYDEFEYEKYGQIIRRMDYYLFERFDEDSMGYLDAIYTGVGTIVTPQGFHLDNGYPIDYPCRTISEFQNAFLDLQTKRRERIQSVEKWNWSNYTLKHVKLWNYIMHRESFDDIYGDQLKYQDGIFSVLLEDDRI